MSAGGSARRLSPVERYLRRRESRRPDPVVAAYRRRLVSGLSGEVVEIGCGDGANFAHYPRAVARVLAVEPEPAARAAASGAARRAPVPVEVVAGTAERLPADTGSFDAAVCTWVLCTVPDPGAALTEIRRVLGPGGSFHFYEHVLADTRGLRLVQRAVDASSLWPRLLGGCHTARETEAAIRNAGFRIDELERWNHATSWLTLPASPNILGVASLDAAPRTVASPSA